MGIVIRVSMIHLQRAKRHIIDVVYQILVNRREILACSFWKIKADNRYLRGMEIDEGVRVTTYLCILCKGTLYGPLISSGGSIYSIVF